MRNFFRYGLFIVAFILPFCIYTHSYAQDEAKLSAKCEECYWRGYDDGYDDAYDDCPCPSFSYIADLGRFYLALSLGINSFQFQRTVMFEDEDIFRGRSGVNAALLNFLIGYTFLWYNNFYLAGELLFGINSGSSSNSSNVLGYDSNVSARNSYGFAILPGWRFLNMLYFLRFGYVRTNFEVKDRVGTFNDSSSQWVNGFSYGIGVETKVFKNFDLRIEANRINYNGFNSILPMMSVIRSNNSFTDNQAIVTGVYRFNF